MVIKRNIKRKKIIPGYEEFRQYALDKSKLVSMQLDLSALRLKYEAWKDDGWRDGNGSEIKNWKSKLGHVLKYLKKDPKDPNNGPLPNFGMPLN